MASVELVPGIARVIETHRFPDRPPALLGVAVLAGERTACLAVRALLGRDARGPGGEQQSEHQAERRPGAPSPRHRAFVVHLVILHDNRRIARG